jgi:recombination protein RecA
LDWKLSLLDNVPYSAYENKKGAKFVDFRATPQLFPIWEEVYSPTGGKRNVKKISKDYLASLSPLSWAVYLMDDGHFDYRTEGLQERTEGGSGRISFCVDALTELSQRNLHEFLLENLGVENKLLTNSVGSTSVNLNVNGTKTFMKLVAEHVHPSMEYKLLPVYRGLFKDSGLEKIETYSTVSEAVIVDIYEKPKTRSMRKFDLEIEGNHNYFVDGVMVHNSPETTTGGKALKFYASIRLDIRRIEQLKEGTEVVGARTRIKVIKNKVAPPFTQAEFDISFMPGSEGFSREGDIIDIGVKHNIVKKGGAWYSYEGEQLGQGKEKARAHLKANPGMANEIEDKILAIVFPKVEDEVEDVTAVKAVKGSKSAKVALDDVPDSDF